ncbi:MAG: hypothetical protein Q9201_005133 [Fulgogasparrea decipioides]
MTAYNSTLTYPNGTIYPITIISSFLNISDVIHNPTITDNDKTFWVAGMFYSVLVTLLNILLSGHLTYYWLRSRKSAAYAWEDHEDDDEGWSWQWGMSLNRGIRFWRRCTGHGGQRINYREGEKRDMLFDEEDAVDEDEEKGHWLAGGRNARNCQDSRVAVGHEHAVAVMGAFAEDDGEHVEYDSDDGETTVSLGSVGSSDSLETLV